MPLAAERIVRFFMIGMCFFSCMRFDLVGQEPSPTFRFQLSSLVISENDSALVRIQKIGTGTGSVYYATVDGTAVGGVDYESRSGWLHFLSVETNKALPVIRTGNDFLINGDRQFSIVLSQPTSGSLGDPAQMEITLLDDDVDPVDSFLEQRSPDPLLPSTNGAVRLTLQPSGTLGQWRIAGERLWRSSDDVATGLARGNHPIEFRPLPGFSSPQIDPVTVLDGRTNLMTVQYVPRPDVGLGSLRVYLQPSFVREDPDPSLHGAWRLPGEQQWHESGETVDLVPDGEYWLEFRSVPDYFKPANPWVRVFAGQRAEVSRSYQLAPLQSGLAPRPVTFDELVSTNLPYQFSGQVRSEFGWGSGVVVKERVVLTAAHVLFDDVHYRYADDVLWMHQKMGGVHQPVAQKPRGWYVFEGYAAQREIEYTPGAQSLNASQLDVAAMYFIEKTTEANFPARGGFSGYLASNAGALNEHYLSDYPMMLVGYPANADTDGMFTTEYLPLSFTHLQGSLFATDQIKGSPGMSGGALFARVGKNFNPVGIHLSRSIRPLFRAFDKDVLDFVDYADSAVDGNPISELGVINVVLESPDYFYNDKWILINILPKIALEKGAGWRWRGFGNSKFHGGKGLTIASIKGKRGAILLRPIPGFVLPTNQTVRIAADQNAVIEVYYEVSPPELRYDHEGMLGIRGTEGTRYRIESRPALDDGEWTSVGEVLLGEDWLSVTGMTTGTGVGRFYRAVWLP